MSCLLGVYGVGRMGAGETRGWGKVIIAPDKFLGEIVGGDRDS